MLSNLRRGAAAVAAIVALAATVMAATPAEAASSAVETYQNRGSAHCLDDSVYGVRTVVCNGMDFQQWRVTVWGDGTRRFQNVHTGNCLGDYGAGKVLARRCDTSKEQSWFVDRSSLGMRFRNQRYGWCMSDTTPGILAMGPCNSGYQTYWL